MTPITRLALTVVVDVANVMGARADGWWRDRAAAAVRLGREVAALAARGVSADRLPDGMFPPGALVDRVLFPQWVLVLEGRAREAATALAEDAPPLVRVVSAAGSGDDTIVSEAAARSADSPCLVLTADRELRRRCEAHGASVAGPGWLLGLL